METTPPRSPEHVALFGDTPPQAPVTPIRDDIPIGDDLPRKKPGELDVAYWLLVEAKGCFARQDRSLFRYSGTHWSEVTPGEIDSIKSKVIKYYNGKGGSRDVDAAYRTFFREVSPVPERVNLFDPQPFCANFQNGTLHIVQDPEYKYTLDFRAHRKEDYLNTVLPYDYRPEDDSTNEEFVAMLTRLFEGDPDIGEKLRAIRQMFGACLVPAFPRFFLLWGGPGTGKSTVIQLAAKLVTERNVCSVDPAEFVGFNMESMIGKLVNFETDIQTRQPIADAEVKKVIDRRKVRIKRKGIADIYGLLPAIHIFGANRIPPTLEGDTGAHDRRWTFIEFKNEQTKGLYNKEFHHWVFEQGSRGILNFALEGLRDLLECRGHYLNPTSGKKAIASWQKLYDSVATFVDDIEAGEVRVAAGPGPDLLVSLIQRDKGFVQRTKLYQIYLDWTVQSGERFAPLTRGKFYDAVRTKKFVDKIVEGVRGFGGFQVG